MSDHLSHIRSLTVVEPFQSGFRWKYRTDKVPTASEQWFGLYASEQEALADAELDFERFEQEAD